MRIQSLEGGLDRALDDKQRPGASPVLQPAERQRTIAMVCSDPPGGHARWTLRLIAQEAVKRKLVPRVGRETIRILLQSHDLAYPGESAKWDLTGLNVGFSGTQYLQLDLGWGHGRSGKAPAPPSRKLAAIIRRLLSPAPGLPVSPDARAARGRPAPCPVRQARPVCSPRLSRTRRRATHYTITFNAAPAVTACGGFSAPSCPGGTLGVSYTAAMGTTGGTPIVTLAVTSGSLPPGL